MQQPDFEFQLGKNIRLCGVGWRGFLAFVVLIMGVVLGGPAVGKFAQTAGTMLGWH